MAPMQQKLHREPSGHALEQHRCLGAGTHVSANQCRERKSAPATSPSTAAMPTRFTTFAPSCSRLNVEFFLKINKNVEGFICRDYGQQHLTTYACKVGDVNCLRLTLGEHDVEPAQKKPGKKIKFMSMITGPAFGTVSGGS